MTPYGKSAGSQQCLYCHDKSPSLLLCLWCAWVVYPCFIVNALSVSIWLCHISMEMPLVIKASSVLGTGIVFHHPLWGSLAFFRRRWAQLNKRFLRLAPHPVMLIAVAMSRGSRYASGPDLTAAGKDKTPKSSEATRSSHRLNWNAGHSSQKKEPLTSSMSQPTAPTLVILLTPQVPLTFHASPVEDLEDLLDQFIHVASLKSSVTRRICIVSFAFNGPARTSV